MKMKTDQPDAVWQYWLVALWHGTTALKSRNIRCYNCQQRYGTLCEKWLFSLFSVSPGLMVNSASLISWLLSYGYFAIFLGSFLEVEAVLIMAGLVAHGSYLNLCQVMVIATLGSFTGDQLCFYLGNRHGWQILKRFPGLQARTEKIHALLARYHLPLILGVRFMYGLRIAGPIAFGMSSIPWSRFLALNLLGALVWVITFSGVGYLFGQTVELELANLHHYEGMLLGLIVIGGVIFWLGNIWRQDK